MRVAAIEGDQLALQISEMVYNKAEGVVEDIDSKKALSDSYYSEEPIYFDSEFITALKAEGAIHVVKRH